MNRPRALFVGLCALVAVLALPVSGSLAGGKKPVTGTLESVGAPGDGATAAADTTIYVIAGTPAANRISAYEDSTGRLVITSPDGIVEPDGTDTKCTQDSPTQVSCIPGLIGAIAGDLGAGNDTFTAASTLPTLIGISLVSEQRALLGGAGRDRIEGGLAGDLVSGGAGQDALLGFGGGDLINGGAGKDALSGGGASDALFGGKGPDKLDGGAARDLCNGGPGMDTAKSCNIAKKIP